MKKLCLVVALASAVTLFGQSKFGNRPGGQFSLGVRTATSLFSDESGIGTGFGGQFRLRFFHLLNSEWFADYITSDIGGGIGNRTDYHIGWSVMFYPSFAYRNNERLKLQPYFLAGHCFDWSRFEGNDFAENNVVTRTKPSMAVQTGLGFHLPVHERVDFSASAQYMIHLGEKFIVETRQNTAGSPYLYFDTDEPDGLEGHLLITFSLNFRIADLWKNKIKGVQDKAPVLEEGQ
jgi:hypothetical protein